MSRVKKTYIVNVPAPGGRFVAFTLRDYCARADIPYGTILARIFRARPNAEEGVIFFDVDDRVFDGYETFTPGQNEHPGVHRVSRRNRLKEK